MNLPFSTRLTLRQLRHIGFRLVGTFAGVCVAILLVFMQIGFLDAVIGSALNLPRALQADLFVVGPQYESLAYTPPWFARDVLYRAQSVQGVADVRPFYTFIAQVRDPRDGSAMAARFSAFDPASPVLDVPGLQDGLPYLNLPRAALLDSRSRRKFATAIAAVEAHGEQRIYLQNLTTTLAPDLNAVGLYRLGPDFTIDGGFIVSTLNYYRFFHVPLDRVSLGLVRLVDGVDPDAARDALAARLGDGVRVKTREQFLTGEHDYFVYQTPIGIILGFGLLVGVFIGVVFVMQALYSIIEMNIAEYAVLRAMGYRDKFFIALVLQIALVIGFGAFVPSLLLTAGLYELVAGATKLSFELTGGVVLTVLVAVLVMSATAVLFAARKLRRSNPLDLFS